MTDNDLYNKLIVASRGQPTRKFRGFFGVDDDLAKLEIITPCRHVGDGAGHGVFAVVETDLRCYKKVSVYSDVYEVEGNDDCAGIATLIVPRGAVIFITRGKCRASEAVVKSIRQLRDMWNQPVARPVFRSSHDWTFRYRRGTWVCPEYDFGSAFSECESGIHFLRTEAEAEAY